MLRVYIKDRMIPAFNFNYSVTQTQIPNFVVRLYAGDIADLDVYLEPIRVYYEGYLLAEGFIRNTQPKATFSSESSIHVIHTTLNCEGFLGLLANEAAYDFYFQNTAPSVAITSMLAAATDSLWELGDISTLDNTPITIDVRGLETLLGQINDLVSNCASPTYVRYGGFNETTGKHRLDVGYFKRPQYDLYILDNENMVKTPQFNEPAYEPIKYLRPLSGPSPDIPVSLDWALNVDPTLSDTSRDYYIQTNTGFVVNNTVDKGLRITKTYASIKTQNTDVPAQAEKNDVAHALYWRAVSEMKARQPYVAFTVDCVLPRMPDIHDSVYVRMSVPERVINPDTMQYEDRIAYELDGYFRVVAIRQDFENFFQLINESALEQRELPSQVLYTLELSSGDYEDPSSYAELLFKQLDTRDKFDTALSVTGTSPFSVPQQISHGPSVTSDCTISGHAGKTFTFTRPTPPSGATQATFGVTGIIPSGSNYTFVQQGSLSQDAIICADDNGNAWTTSSQVTVSGVWIFS